MLAQVNTLNSLPFLNESSIILLFSRPFYCSVEGMKVASIDWIRKSKSNSTIVKYVRRDFDVDWRYQ